jgi:hypothetical protein
VPADAGDARAPGAQRGAAAAAAAARAAAAAAANEQDQEEQAGSGGGGAAGGRWGGGGQAEDGEEEEGGELEGAGGGGGAGEDGEEDAGEASPPFHPEDPADDDAGEGLSERVYRPPLSQLQHLQPPHQQQQQLVLTPQEELAFFAAANAGAAAAAAAAATAGRPPAFARGAPPFAAPPGDTDGDAGGRRGPLPGRKARAAAAAAAAAAGGAPLPPMPPAAAPIRPAASTATAGPQWPPPTIAVFDVGGRVFKTRASLFRAFPTSLLARLACDFGDPALAAAAWVPSGSSPSGAIFLDLNPDYFAVILDYCRTRALLLPASLSLEGVADAAHALGMHAAMFGDDAVRTFSHADEVRSVFVCWELGIAPGACLASQNRKLAARLRAAGPQPLPPSVISSVE